jgi:hypothetical protein
VDVRWDQQGCFIAERLQSRPFVASPENEKALFGAAGAEPKKGRTSKTPRV